MGTKRIIYEIIQIAFGAGSLIVGLILKAIPYGKEKPRQEVDPVV